MSPEGYVNREVFQQGILADLVEHSITMMIFNEIEKNAALFDVIFAAINKFFLSVNVRFFFRMCLNLKMLAHST